MNNTFNQHKENLKRHLSQGYNKDLSLDDFYSWANETYSMCEELVKIMKNNISNYRNNNEELEKIFKEYWNIREIKKFMEEAHPLKIFLETNCDDLSFDSVFLTNGNENHDAILKKEDKEIFVEITGTQDGQFILYSLLHMYQLGSAPSIGARTEELYEALKNGNPAELNFKRVDESIKKEAEEVNEAIKKKCAKNYPNKTLLIITAFNNQPTPSCDPIPNCEVSQNEFDRLMNLNPALDMGLYITNTKRYYVSPNSWDLFRCYIEDLPESSEKFNGIYLIGLYDKSCKPLSQRI